MRKASEVWLDGVTDAVAAGIAASVAACVDPWGSLLPLALQLQLLWLLERSERQRLFQADLHVIWDEQMAGEAIRKRNGRTSMTGFSRRSSGRRRTP